MREGRAESPGPAVKGFGEYLVYLFFRFVEEVFCLIPGEEIALALGRFFGRLMFVFGMERRTTAIENLTIAFGNERSRNEIRQIARRNFEHLGMLGVEFFRIRRWNHQMLAKKLVIKGKENFDLAWAPGRRGILYITAHVGSFEVLAAASRFLGIRLNLVVTPAPNRFVNERMMFRRGGAESGLNILPHRGIVSKVIGVLRSGETVVVLADQRGDDSRPIWVDFFGKQVLANGIFAKFAAQGDASVFPVMSRRMDDGRYLCEFGEEIPIQVTGDQEADLWVNSQRFHNVFETWLRECPEQGFWMHRKFKRKSKRANKKRFSLFRPSRLQHDS